jgi:ethanolamine-phosphate phospho-lyase
MEQIAAKFGLKIIDAKSLDGDINYSNRKYVLTAADGKKYILKVFPDEKEWILAREESLLLAAIGDQLSFKVPQNIALENGDLFFQYDGDNAKLLHYIDGDFIADAVQTEQLLYALGTKIAALNKLLMPIENAVLAARKLFWDIQHTQMSSAKLQNIVEPERRKIIRYYIDRFVQFVLPVQHNLRHAIIHGDLNDYNILVKNGEIAGFLDFGDSTYTPVVNELAIAMTYIMLGKADPFDAVLPLLKGYHSVFRLTREEVDLLPDLITSRLCISLCNSAEKKQLGLDNAYVLVSEQPAWQLIELWIKTNPLAIRKKFLEATGYDYTPPEDIAEKRQRLTGKSLGLSYGSPITMSTALFQYMFNSKGHTYLDAYNNIPHIGHAHPKIAEAVSTQVRLLNTNTRYLYTGLTGYAEKLLQYFPPQLCKVFFVNSGSEASDLAIRMSRVCSNRNKVAVLQHGYHGNTALAIAISSYKFDGKGGKGISDEIICLPLPNEFDNQNTSGAALAEEAIGIIEKSVGLPAAFIAEPISGCGGQVPLASGYLKRLYAYCRQQNILTISDEVQTGFGRLGTWFWGFELHNVVPDIVVLGKPMANGHPMAAVVTTQAVADAFANGMEFFSSFGGNPVSCAAGETVLDVLNEEGLQQNARLVGAYLKDNLKQLQKEHQAIADIRGEGLFLGIEFWDQQQKPAAALAGAIKEGLKAQFILSGTDGPFDNVLKIKPPMCFSIENAAEFVEKLSGLLKQ